MTWYTTDQQPATPSALLRLLRLWSLRADCTPDLENTFLLAGVPWDVFTRVRPKLWEGASVTLDAGMGPSFPVDKLQPWLDKGYINASFPGGTLSHLAGKVTLRLESLDRVILQVFVRILSRTEDADRLRAITEHLLVQPHAIWRVNEEAVEFAQVEFGREYTARTDTKSLGDRWVACAKALDPAGFQAQLRRLTPAALDEIVKLGAFDSRTVHLHAGPGAVVADLLPVIDELANDDIDELKAETAFGAVPVRGKRLRTQFRVLYDTDRGTRTAVWADDETQAADVARAVGASLKTVETR
jgi:hypothetical protein